VGAWRYGVAAWGVAVWLLGACAGSGRPAGGEVIVAAKGYRLAAPPGWRRVPSDADLALRDEPRQAGLMVHGSCEPPASRRPLGVLARHLRFGLRDVRDLSERRVEVAGQAAVRAEFLARLDERPVAVAAVTLQAQGCAYDLVVVAPPDAAASAAEDLDRLLLSFQLTGAAR
jgi:hypothetical protein